MCVVRSQLKVCMLMHSGMASYIILSASCSGSCKQVLGSAAGLLWNGDLSIATDDIGAVTNRLKSRVRCMQFRFIEIIMDTSCQSIMHPRHVVLFSLTIVTAVRTCDYSVCWRLVSVVRAHAPCCQLPFQVTRYCVLGCCVGY